jgi:hypothetical protein
MEEVWMVYLSLPLIIVINVLLIFVALPSNIKTIAQVKTSAQAGQGPSINQIIDILNSHGIHPKKYYISVQI